MDYIIEQELLIKGIEESLKSFDDPKQRIAVAARIVDWAKNSMIESMKARRHDAYKKRKAMSEASKPQIRLLTKLSLGNGNLIRLKGTRDYGIREIIDISGSKVRCYQLAFKPMLNWNTSSGLIESYFRTGRKTIHDLGNITHISEDGLWQYILDDWVS